MTSTDPHALRDAFRGELIDPGGRRFDEPRSVYNAMIDRRPTIIARCLDAADVAAAVDFGRDPGCRWQSTAAATA